MVHSAEQEWGCLMIPGPYVLDETVGVNSAPVYLIETAAGDSVANTRDKATALAIVALPASLEALSNALNWWHSKPGNFDRKEPAWLEQARAALKLAGGGQ